MNIETLIQGIRELRKHGLLIVDAPSEMLVAGSSKEEWAQKAAANILGMPLPAEDAVVQEDVVRLAVVLREAADTNAQQWADTVV